MERSVDQKTVYEPYMVSSKQINDMVSSRMDNEFILNMIIGCLARIFSLASGRNKGASWINYDTIKHLRPEIDQEIAEELDHF